jgi:4-aminobutyrate aminotransferase-like enzyme
MTKPGLSRRPGARLPVAVRPADPRARGRGRRGRLVLGRSGRRYLDFSSQLVNVNLGHQHPVVVRAIQEQAATRCTVAPSFGNATRGEAARLSAEVAPGYLRRVFFTNGGTEANEHAVRMARLTTARHKVLAAYRSCHGATAASLTLTGAPRRWASALVCKNRVGQVRQGRRRGRGARSEYGCRD